ncbi:hypothetical protein AKO1_002180, partial [Acrasis kona]
MEEYREGDKIWVCVPGHPWWPAKVVNQNTSEALEFADQKGICNVLVQFYQSNDHYWLHSKEDLDKMKPFTGKDSNPNDKSLKDSALTKAINIADKSLGNGTNTLDKKKTSTPKKRKSRAEEESDSAKDNLDSNGLTKFDSEDDEPAAKKPKKAQATPKKELAKKETKETPVTPKKEITKKETKEAVTPVKKDPSTPVKKESSTKKKSLTVTNAQLKEYNEEIDKAIEQENTELIKKHISFLYD